MENDLARIRAEVKAKRPAEAWPMRHGGDHQVDALRYAVHAVNVRPIARPPAPTAPGRVARFHAWRRRHYVADQALRVVAILAGAVGLLGLVGFLLALALTSLLNGIDSGTLAAGVGLLVVLLAAGFLLSSSAPTGQRKGYGFHWSKCDH